MADDVLQFQFKKAEPSKKKQTDVARKVQTFQTRGIYNQILVVCGVDPVLGHIVWFPPGFNPTLPCKGRNTRLWQNMPDWYSVAGNNRQTFKVFNTFERGSAIIIIIITQLCITAILSHDPLSNCCQIGLKTMWSISDFRFSLDSASLALQSHKMRSCGRSTPSATPLSSSLVAALLWICSMPSGMGQDFNPVCGKVWWLFALTTSQMDLGRHNRHNFDPCPFEVQKNLCDSHLIVLIAEQGHSACDEVIPGRTDSSRCPVTGSAVELHPESTKYKLRLLVMEWNRTSSWKQSRNL